jgi:hypothetical protein
MQRAHGGAEEAAAAAAAATVAPLLQLKRAAQKANKLARHSRAVELYERTVTAAELALPRDSLVIAALLSELAVTHCIAQATDNYPSDAVLASLKLRSLRLLHARWQAGTLLAPTAEEVAYLAEDEFPHLPAQMCGAYFYITAAEHMAAAAVNMRQDISPYTPAEAEAVYGALRAALETDTRGMLERNRRTGQAGPVACSTKCRAERHLRLGVHSLVTSVLCDEAGLLLHMRATCGLTAAEETALRQLAERHKAESGRRAQELPEAIEDVYARQQQTAAADAARHGLRRCALPACDAQEPHPKLFKLCGRCRGAAYCCPEHSKEDWKRHKCEDGCAAAAEAS